MKRVKNKIPEGFFDLSGIDIKPIEIGLALSLFGDDKAKYNFKPSFIARIDSVLRGSQRKTARVIMKHEFHPIYITSNGDMLDLSGSLKLENLNSSGDRFATLKHGDVIEYEVGRDGRARIISALLSDKKFAFSCDCEKCGGDKCIMRKNGFCEHGIVEFHGAPVGEVRTHECFGRKDTDISEVFRIAEQIVLLRDNPKIFAEEVETIDNELGGYADNYTSVLYLAERYNARKRIRARIAEMRAMGELYTEHAGASYLKAVQKGN
ncbi:MAG: hypothetical protein FWD15_01510 [Alphaproteobacteria bacterium]|nr:hypothetical protein [Alphaproteobacteria bacterium]